MTKRYDLSDLQMYGAEDYEDLANILDALDKADEDAPSAGSAPGERS